MSIPEHIVAIARAAAAAPSGDNSQPWHFAFRAPDHLEFHAHPEEDHPILNVEDSGTLIALGAALENATLEAKALGFSPKVTISSTLTEPCVAVMELLPGGSLSPHEAPLREAIPHRVSNRKPYDIRPLAEEDRIALLGHMKVVPGVTGLLLEDRTQMATFARNLTIMERIALSHQALHRHFFADIFWSHTRNRAGEKGLHGKTLELPPPAQALFRLLRHWPVARTLARIGFPTFVAETNAKQNESASAFGAIMSDKLDRNASIQTGRLLERLWLEATARGLSFQIVTGILFLARYIEREEKEGLFSSQEHRDIREADATIHQLLGGAAHPILTFRVGYGKAPTARSYRKEPRIEVVD